MDAATISDNQMSPQAENLHDCAVSVPEVDPAALNQMSLKLVDELRQHGIDKDIELPQIIVCGNQSCGKSSVLEAISGLNFPRDDGICTTFATELILRRGPQTGGSVRIPSIKFEAILDSLEKFGDAIQDAKKALQKHHGAGQETVFQETLQIQVSHPSWPPLTLVDLPGLIQNQNLDQESADVKMIRQIVERYMRASKTIILAVVHGSDEPANQGVLTLAKSYDASGQRTIGVITKPDYLRSGSKTEAEYLRYASNDHNKFKFKHWHVVKNRDYREDCTLQERDDREANFFASSVWEKKLDKDQLGIDALRIKLSTVLEEHVRHELPSVINSLSKELKECRTELARLGPPRDSNDQQEEFLMHISQKFQDIVKQATDGRYDDGLFHSSPDRKLRSSVEEQNDYFVQFIYKNGHRYEEANTGKSEGSTRSDLETGDASFPRPAEFPPSYPEEVSRSQFVELVRKIQRENRAKEFPGTFNSDQINILFRQQSERWREIAAAHVENIWASAAHTIQGAVYAVASGQTADRLVEYLNYGDPAESIPGNLIQAPSDIGCSMEVLRERLQEKLHEILQPYEKHHAITHDPEYSRRRRHLFALKEEMERQVVTKHLSAGQDKNTETYVSEKLSTYQRTPDEYVSNASEILDLMQLYYKVSLRTFVDNVAVLVLENCLMYNLHELFTNRKVRAIARTRPDLLEFLAGEPESVRQKRSALEAKQQRLEKAQRLCQQNSRAGHLIAPKPAYLSVPTPSPRRTREALSPAYSAAHDRSRSAGTPIRQPLSSNPSPRSSVSAATSLTTTSSGNSRQHERSLSDRAASKAQDEDFYPFKSSYSLSAGAGPFDRERSPTPKSGVKPRRSVSRPGLAAAKKLEPAVSVGHEESDAETL